MSAGVDAARVGSLAPVVRTVLGDVPAAELGVTYAHEHLIIDGGTAKIINPEISLQSVEDAVAELAPCRGVRLD